MAQPGRARDSYDLFGEIPMSWVQIPLDPPTKYLTMKRADQIFLKIKTTHIA